MSKPSKAVMALSLGRMALVRFTSPDPRDVLKRCPPPGCDPGSNDQAEPDSQISGDMTYGSSTVTNRDTMLYQIEHLEAPVTQLETHLAEGCRILGKRCDCCRKHAGQLATFARETIPIAARSGQDTGLYAEMAGWAQNLQSIPLDSDDSAFHQESGKASVFAKRLRAMKAEVDQGGNANGQM